MDSLKNKLETKFFYVVLAIAMAALVVGCSDWKKLDEIPAGVMFVLAVAGLLVGVLGIWLAVRYHSETKKEIGIQEIKNFVDLHNTMTAEMEKILLGRAGQKRHLHILSFTPAFGNISTPELYETDDQDYGIAAEGKKAEVTYKGLIEKIVEKGNYDVDVKIICYNEEKRREYYESWGDVVEKDAAKREEKIRKWENQAKYIIGIVRGEWGEDSVIEVNHMQPILFFSTDSILIQYAIRIDTVNKKSVVSGIKLKQEKNIKFFNTSFGEFYDKPSGVSALFENCFGAGSLAVQEARQVQHILTGLAAEDRREVCDLDILLAYGGGKDSTMILLVLKYVQDLFLRKSKSPFKLHILVHVHPGMRGTVLRNIYHVFKGLKLDTDTNVEITFKSKGAVLDVKSFINENFNSETVSIPIESKEKFKREILMFGHLSRGLGRHTFCYTCNIDMVMSVIDYALSEKGNIDYIVSGDSEEEQEAHGKWLNLVFGFINKKNVDIGDGSYNPELFFKDFVGLRNCFETCFELGNKRTDSDMQIENYPKLFKIYKYVNFTLSNESRALLERELSFAFHDESFNFSETDCFYPAVMAHMAGLGGGKNYDKHLGAHIKHVTKIMKKKNFPRDLIDKARGPYIPTLEDSKRKEIMNFLSTMFGIDEKKLDAIVYSPFLNNGERLQLFLDKKNTGLKSASVIRYIKKGNMSVIDYMKGKMNLSADEETKIESFINEYIGLSCEDIKKILSFSGDQKEVGLLNVIAKGDPYVDEEVDLGNGEKIIVSGR